jgi:seryl-tRNA synthetase
MPCRDDWPSDPVVSQRSYDEQKKRLDEVTQLLCFCCGTLHHTNVMSDVASLRKWWEKHRQQDERRVRKEMQQFVSNHPNMPHTQVANHFIDKAIVVHPVSKFHINWFCSLAQEICSEHKRSVAQENRVAEARQRALSKLTKEDRLALGIR